MAKAKADHGEQLSLNGAKWQLAEPAAFDVLHLTSRHQIPEFLARILVNRGIGAEELTSFLEPKLKHSLPAPTSLLDAEKAAERIAKAIKTKESIAVFGDYDVDGATSSALWRRFFRHFGIEIEVYIPDRIKEGYGPNVTAMQQLAKNNSLCITVDCGTSSFEALKAAKEAGMEVIVVDHHLSAETLPEAHAIVNPNRIDHPNSPCRQMAAVGVSFMLIVATMTALKTQNLLDTHKKLSRHPQNKNLLDTHENSNLPDTHEAPDLLAWMDLVGLGTVCDVMPVTGVNRAFVAQGLKVLHRRGNKGLAALADIAGITQVPSCYHLGFVFGPRINAGGRVGQAALGSELLASESAEESKAIAEQLQHYNQERQTIEQMVLEQAIAQVEASEADQPVIIVSGEHWHQGVIGIVAGRLKERYYRPVAVIALEGEEGKASARSIGGIDFGSAVIAAKQAGILTAGGGHAMAAGFSLKKEQIPTLKTFLFKRFADQMQLHGTPTTSIDATITLAGATIELAEQLTQLAPFGIGNPEPKLMLKDIYIINAQIVGEKHVKCLFGEQNGATLKAIAFQAVDTAVGEFLLDSKGCHFNAVGKLKINEWNGRRMVDFVVEDVALA